MAPLIRKLFGDGELGKLVKFAPLIAGSVPVMFAAGIFVKFAALIAGNAPLSFEEVNVDILASATVPVRLPAGILVKFAPLPTKLVAVITPVTSIPCEFEVTAEPTTIRFAVAVVADNAPVSVVEPPT